MKNTTTTPPVQRTLFRVIGNEENLKKFQKRGFSFEISNGYACFTGNVNENSEVRYAFAGAVTA